MPISTYLGIDKNMTLEPIWPLEYWNIQVWMSFTAQNKAFESDKALSDFVVGKGHENLTNTADNQLSL